MPSLLTPKIVSKLKVVSELLGFKNTRIHAQPVIDMADGDRSLISDFHPSDGVSVYQEFASSSANAAVSRA